MEGFSQTLNNGLTVSIDWLSFTIMSIPSLDKVLASLGYTIADFDDMPHGGKGYKSMIRLNGYAVNILYDGNDNMGIHVDVCGSAVHEVLRSFKTTLKESSPFGDSYCVDDFNTTYLCELLKMIRKNGQITRLDLAVDDIGCNYFSTDDVFSLFVQSRIVSKFRNIQNLASYSCGIKSGHTVSFGNRKSDIYMRVYDKQLERNQKSIAVDYPWVRWEVELKGGRANTVAVLLISGMPLGELCMSVFSNYIRIIHLDNENRSRCSVDETWQRFLDGMKPLKLYVAPVIRDLEDKKDWVNQQVMPTIAGIIASDGGSFEFFEEHLISGLMRMKKPLLDMVRSKNPHVDELFE